METVPVTGYQIVIDGVPIGHEAVFEAAKARAIAAADGVSSTKITRQGDFLKAKDGAIVSVPNEAWYWDYKVEDWIQSTSPGSCNPKRKSE